MILELVLHDFILAKSVECSFEHGFTVITGETGAGKSILVHAVKLLLGGRADVSVVRSGAEQAVIQGVFSTSPLHEEILEQSGIPFDDSGEITVRRVIPSKGRGRIFLNGSPVTLQELKKVMAGIVSISGQHEYHDLLDRNIHRKWLDDFAGSSVLLEQVKELFSERVRFKEALDEVVERGRRLAQEQTELRKNVDLIDSVAPKPGEEAELEQKLVILKASKELGELGSDIFNTLYNGKGSVYESLSSCRTIVEKMSRHDPALEKRLEDMDGLVYQTEELAWAFRDYVNDLPADFSEFERVDERLYSLRQLKRKFGPDLEDVLQYREESAEKLRLFDNIEIESAEAERRLKEYDVKLVEAAFKLSDFRKGAAAKFSELVKSELSELKLAESGFVVDVRSPDVITADNVTGEGADQVEFLFCPNPGEPFGALASIASGGELSRVMLAVKSVLARKSGTGAIIFDEIDAGIGGEVADRVGRKLDKLSEEGQIIAITHFPQIAAAGHLHYTVEKDVIEGRTVSVITRLDSEGRLDELARMLGGDMEAAREYAGELFATFFRGA